MSGSIILRDYQDKLVSGARSLITSGVKRIMVQSPAGSGKTVTASYMVKGIVDRGMRVMFAVHREELAKQASKTFRAFGIHHGYIMSSMSMDIRLRAHVAMIDTLRNRVTKVPRPDVLIIDEAHHAVSPSWRKLIDHYAEQGTLIIGLSATPCRLDGKPLRGLFDAMVLGPSVKHLIGIGALSDYTYFAPPMLLDLAKVKTRMGDYAQDQLAEASDKPAIIGDAVEHYKRLLPGKRAIGFAVNIEHSKHIASMFASAGVPAAHVDGETPANERAATIEAFARGDIKVMSNVALFGEGFDVPSCEGVLMLRATQSLSLHIQVCGRAMRPSASKQSAILLDHVGNFLRHGLPDDDREWSLDGRKKKAGGKAAAEETIPLKQCPTCYRVHEPAPQCPFCDHVYEAAARTMEQVDGDLKAITAEDKALLQRQMRIEVAKAKTLEELESIAAQRGYKPGWARAVHESRKKKSTGRPPPVDLTPPWEAVL